MISDTDSMRLVMALLEKPRNRAATLSSNVKHGWRFFVGSALFWVVVALVIWHLVGLSEHYVGTRARGCAPDSIL